MEVLYKIKIAITNILKKVIILMIYFYLIDLFYPP
jgi:hypothetical protein